MAGTINRLRTLYEGRGEQSRRFRYGLLAFDLGTILFVVASSFMPPSPVISGIDVLLGLIALADFLARLAISPRRLREFLRPTTWADIAAILSFLATPLFGNGLAFLRILRTLRLLRSYHLLGQLRRDSAFFRRNDEVILAATNLAVFIFVMTGIVYATQHEDNDQINNYLDALYFTVTSLTTTGYGDVTLKGTSGRLISVVVMICGVTLFLRLAQVLFRPHKVRFPCPECGLQRHETDAVHCKACGTRLAIPDDGAE